MRLRHEAVLVKAGSYDIRPKSSGEVLISRKWVARTTPPSSIGISYCLPVRLSVIVSVFFAIGLPRLSACWRRGRQPRHQPAGGSALFRDQHIYSLFIL